MLLDRSETFEFHFHLSLANDEIENFRRKLLDQCFVEFEFLGVVDFVELYDELWVKVEEKSNPVDKFFHDFESSLGFDDGRLTQSLFEVVDYLIVFFLGFLDVFALPRPHFNFGIYIMKLILKSYN